MLDPEETSRRIAYLYHDMALSPFTVAWMTPEEWDRPAFITGAGDHYPLGFTVPFLKDALYLVFLCPEVLVGHADDLTTEEFFVLCTSVRMHLMLHMAQEDRGLDLGGEDLEAAVLAAQRAITELDFAVFDRLWKGAIH